MFDYNRFPLTRSRKQISDLRERPVATPFLDKHYARWCLTLPKELRNISAQDFPNIVAVGGGKGGVGKSLISANLAAKLGELGFRVLLVDLDWGGANLHTYFGLATPRYTINDFLQTGKESLSSIRVPTNSKMVDLVAGGRRELALGGTELGNLIRIWKALSKVKSEMNADFVVLDLGAGTEIHTVDFFAAAHVGISAVLPEPTSIENAYAFLKATFVRQLKYVGERLGEESATERLISELLTAGNAHGFGFAEKITNLRRQYPAIVDAFVESLRGRYVGLVLNQTRSYKDLEIGSSMEQICRSYFGYQANFLGALNYDEAAWKALRNRRLLVGDFPHSLISKRVEELARKIAIMVGY